METETPMTHDTTLPEEPQTMPVELTEPLPAAPESIAEPETAPVAQAPAAAEEELPAAPASADSPDITHRLAAEFITMQQEVPGLHAPEDLAAEIWDTAAREGIPLLDAFLRFRWQEEQRVRREKERRRRTAACSSGSLREGGAESHPEQDAFVRSFRRAMR